MPALYQQFRSVGRRTVAAWLLLVFCLVQAVPVVALTVIDGMEGMACCKKGSASCCRRKPMQSPPSFRAPHPCGLPCAGTPAVPLHGNAAVTPAFLSFFAFVVISPALFVTESEARASAGVDPSQYQRPPPIPQA